MTGDTTWAKIERALDAHKLKRAGANEYRANIPWRTGSNSQALAIRVDADGEHGAWKDHVSGDGGSLYQLAERLGIETPKAQAQETKRAYSGLPDYAGAHYAPTEAFAAAGYVEGTHKGRPCLIYMVGGTERYRYLDGQKPPYEWEPGGTAAWYGLKRAAERAAAANRALILCNGEASTIAAQHHGLPACAWAGGEQKLPEHALSELKAAYSGPVILAYDCDETGQRVAREVAEQLEAAGYAVRVADLGMTTGGDLADFCGLYTTAAWAELDKRAAAPVPDMNKLADQAKALEREAKAAVTDPQAALERQANQLAAQVERIQAAIAPPRVVELHELATETLQPRYTRRWGQLPIPELAALVGPLEPELYVLLAATGMGKSWFAAGTASALTRSLGTGLVVTTETSPLRFFERMASWTARVPLDSIRDGLATDIEREAWRGAAALYKNYEGWILDMSSPTPMQVETALKNARAKVGLAWMIVDSASRMNGADGVYERMTSVANGLQNMARDFNIPVITTSQVGRDVSERSKGKRQPHLDDGYGSGAIEHNAGAVLGLYRHDYYVKQELETPDEIAYPLNTARLILLKHRNRRVPDQPWCTVKYEAGCGFYPYAPRNVNELPVNREARAERTA